MTNRFFKPTVTKQSTGNAYFHGWKEWKKGDSIIGEYLSSYESSYKGQKNINFRVKVLESTFKIKDDAGKFIDLKEKVLVLNGVGQLNKFMQDVKEGMLIEVVYGGKLPGKDGTLYHTFDRLEAGFASQEDQAEDNL